MPAPKTAIDESLKKVDEYCKGPEHRDYYVYRDAMHIALSLMTPVNHSRFRRQLKEYQKLQRGHGGTGCTIDAFLLKKSNPTVSPYSNRPKT